MKITKIKKTEAYYVLVYVGFLGPVIICTYIISMYIPHYYYARPCEETTCLFGNKMAVSSFFVPCLFLERQHRIITFVSVELEASIEGLQGPIIVKFKNRSKNKTPRSDFWSGTRDTSGFQSSLKINLLAELFTLVAFSDG